LKNNNKKLNILNGLNKLKKKENNNGKKKNNKEKNKN
jgi:hypothetical protein